MPAKTKKQQRFFGAELARKRAGKPTQTKLPEASLKDFATIKAPRKKGLDFPMAEKVPNKQGRYK